MQEPNKSGIRPTITMRLIERAEGPMAAFGDPQLLIEAAQEIQRLRADYMAELANRHALTWALVRLRNEASACDQFLEAGGAGVTNRAIYQQRIREADDVLNGANPTAQEEESWSVVADAQEGADRK